MPITISLSASISISGPKFEISLMLIIFTVISTSRLTSTPISRSILPSITIFNWIYFRLHRYRFQYKTPFQLQFSINFSSNFPSLLLHSIRIPLSFSHRSNPKATSSPISVNYFHNTLDWQWWSSPRSKVPCLGSYLCAFGSLLKYFCPFRFFTIKAFLWVSQYFCCVNFNPTSFRQNLLGKTCLPWVSTRTLALILSTALTSYIDDYVWHLDLGNNFVFGVWGTWASHSLNRLPQSRKNH